MSVMSWINTEHSIYIRKILSLSQMSSDLVEGLCKCITENFIKHVSTIGFLKRIYVVGWLDDSLKIFSFIFV